MDQRPFFFKRFALFHHRSTMKIGTDAILLARWTEVFENDDVLDIGTGCGLIPLMLAQKGLNSIDAVEIDNDSYEEAAQNFTTIFCTGVCCTQFYSTTAQNKTNKAHTACVAFDPCPEGEMWTGEKCASFDELGLKSDGGGPKENGYEWKDPNFECSLQIL